MSEVVPARGKPVRARAPVRYYCELDKWSFDPRYTEGRCPICGWAPEGAPTAPKWLARARKFEWELAGLVALLIVLVVLGALVAHAAGYRIPLLSSPANAAAGPAASSTRTGQPSPSPSHRLPSPKVSPSPSASPKR